MRTPQRVLTAIFVLALAPCARPADSARQLPETAYPRILIHNFLTELDASAIKALAQRDVIVLAPWFRHHLETIHKIRELNPWIVILMYATLDSAYYTNTQKRPHSGQVIGIGNLDEARVYAGHPEVWLYKYPAGKLAMNLPPGESKVVVRGLEDDIRATFAGQKRKSLLNSPKPVLAIGDELMRVEAIDGDRLKVRRGQCETKPALHHAGAPVRLVRQCPWAGIVQHTGLPTAELLQINLSDSAPVIGGRKPWQIKADFYLTTYANDPAWRACFDGFFFDNGHEWQSWANQPLDLNGDGQPDSDAYASLEKGIRSFFAYLRAKGGPDLLVVPNNLDDLVTEANGRHRELFADKVNVPQFTQRESSHWKFSVWEYSMEPYRAYQAAGAQPRLPINSSQPGAWTDYRQMRFALGSCLLLDGCFQFRQQSGDIGNWQHWYDEYSVDDSGASTDGHVGRNWLGKPLGAAQQIVESLTTPNLLAQATWDLRTKGGASARLNTSDDVLDVEVSALSDHRPDNVQLTTIISSNLGPGDTVTLSLEMRASAPRLIQFALAGGDWQPTRSKVMAPLFVSTSWERRIFSFTLRDSRALENYPLSFFVGDDLGKLELRKIAWQMGGAVKGWQREFEHGLVLVNPTLQLQDFAVTGDFKRIRGTQDAVHNSGEPVGRTLTVAPCDAYLLFRSPTGGAKAQSKFAHDDTFKLYAAGRTFNVQKDDLESSPLKESSRDAPAKAAKNKSQAALQQFEGLRPEHFAKQCQSTKEADDPLNNGSVPGDAKYKRTKKKKQTMPIVGMN